MPIAHNTQWHSGDVGGVLDFNAVDVVEGAVVGDRYEGRLADVDPGVAMAAGNAAVDQAERREDGEQAVLAVVLSRDPRQDEPGHAFEEDAVLAEAEAPALGYNVPYAVGNTLLTLAGPLLVALIQ